MKKTLLLGLALALTFGTMAQEAQNVKIKRGKAIMTEASYNELKQKADAYAQLQKEKEQTEAKLKSLELSQRVVISTFEDSASYAIGQDIFNSWQKQQLGINGKVAGQAMIDMFNHSFNWTPKTTNDLLQRFQKSFELRQQQQQEVMKAGMQDNIAAGKKFLTENAKSKAIFTTASGLQYKVVRKGNGVRPKATDVVRAHYTGTLINGTKFDSSYDRGEPLEFTVGQMIPGWIEGVQLMDEGSKYIFYIPYNLAYGEQVVGEIPPGSALIFEVELLEIKK